MRAQAAKLWQNAIESLWFVPMLLMAGAVILSSALLFVDNSFDSAWDLSGPWFFTGSAGAAQTLLSTVAGSMATVISVAFSITLVAIQQASTQYSPRVLRSFTRDRGNQIVLGTFAATFVYSLLVLRQIRQASGGGSAFVPALSITVAMVLALVSIGMLVYYIDHISGFLQVSKILASIREDLRREMDSLFPSRFGRESREPLDASKLLRQMERQHRGRVSEVQAQGSGYLRLIDERHLEEHTPDGVHLVWIPVRVGDHVRQGTTLARIWSDGDLGNDQLREVDGAFALDRERTVHQDVLFGIRQIVDVALKALSPAVNAPTTAEESIGHLGDALAQLLEREFPSPLRRTDRGSLYLFNRPNFADFVDASFGQIRRAGKGQVHVTLRLLGVLGDLAQRVPNPERATPLQTEVEEILAALDSAGFTPKDERTIRDRAAEVEGSLSARLAWLRRAA